MSLSSSEARWRDALEASMKDFLSAYPAGAADELYDPIHYLLSLGGKRIRPVLALAACEAEAGALDAAMPAAMAVELFHNFTLMHDDIMDEAPLRRGRPTVHTKWSENAAILSGDVMYTLALTALEGTPSEALADVLRMFNVTSKEVCEGQQSDMAFETRDNVTVDEYVNMIRLKTSVLLAAAAAMGARSAGASPERVEAWYRFGVNVGLAFQIQDDFLDTFGESGATGKQVGGDILSDKKTLLWLTTEANEEGRKALAPWVGVHSASGSDQGEAKITAVRAAMVAAGADAEAQRRMAQHVEEAVSALRTLNLSPETSGWFEGLAQHVVSRSH